MTDTTFALSRFDNRNGTISWRISGWLASVRIRKNFKSREEAAAEKASLEIKAAQIISGLRTATTFLSDDQLRQAETAFRRLADEPRPHDFFLDYTLANYREPQRQNPLADAVAAYLAVKTKEYERQIIYKPQLTTIRCHLIVLKKHFPNAVVADGYISMSNNQYTFFGDHAALESLTQHGDRLEELDSHIKWPQLVAVAEKIWRAGTDKKAACGPKPWATEVMLRIMVLKRLYNLSDEQVEYQLRDRLSFLRFVQLGLGDSLPDSRAIWLYADQLAKANGTRELFDEFNRQLAERGLLVKEGCNGGCHVYGGSSST
jgi:hypothetical protein